MSAELLYQRIADSEPDEIVLIPDDLSTDQVCDVVCEAFRKTGKSRHLRRESEATGSRQAGEDILSRIVEAQGEWAEARKRFQPQLCLGPNMLPNTVFLGPDEHREFSATVVVDRTDRGYVIPQLGMAVRPSEHPGIVCWWETEKPKSVGATIEAVYPKIVGDDLKRAQHPLSGPLAALGEAIEEAGAPEIEIIDDTPPDPKDVDWDHLAYKAHQEQVTLYQGPERRAGIFGAVVGVDLANGEDYTAKTPVKWNGTADWLWPGASALRNGPACE